MATSSIISTLAQTVGVDGVGDIVVTTIEQDPDSGDYVREIRIFGLPTVAGANKPLVLTLRLRDSDRAAIAITVPSSDF